MFGSSFCLRMFCISLCCCCLYFLFLFLFLVFVYACFLSRPATNEREVRFASNLVISDRVLVEYSTLHYPSEWEPVSTLFMDSRTRGRENLGTSALRTICWQTWSRFLLETWSRFLDLCRSSYNQELIGKSENIHSFLYSVRCISYGKCFVSKAELAMIK